MRKGQDAHTGLTFRGCKAKMPFMSLERGSRRGLTRRRPSLCLQNGSRASPRCLPGGQGSVEAACADAHHGREMKDLALGMRVNMEKADVRAQSAGGLQ